MINSLRRPKGLRISMNSNRNNNNGRAAARRASSAQGQTVSAPRRRRARAGINRGPRPVGSRPVFQPRPGRLGSISTQVNPILPAAAPQQSSGQRHQSSVCARRELVQQVVGTAAFTAVAYPINAGLAQMFAWLSSDAKRYEKYRFRRLAFEYINSVGPADATNAGGNVCMAVDYDVLDSVPVTLQQMNQNETAKLFSPYDKVRMELDPASIMRRGWLYTRNGGVPTGADAKTYDLGSLLLAQSGTSTNGLGNLFVDYEVELDVPQDVPIDGQHVVATAGLTATTLFGSAQSTNIGVPNWTFAAAGDVATCAVAGEYLITMNLTGTVFVVTLAGSSVGGTATSTECAALTDAAQTSATYTFIVRAAVGQTISPAINSATTITQSNVRFRPYRYSLA